MNAPNPFPEANQTTPVSENQPQSLLGNMMGGIQNMASNMMNSMGAHFSSNFEYGSDFPRPGGMYRNFDQDSEMTIENDYSSGRVFLEKFREKNGASIELPPFVEGSFEGIIKEAKRLQRPIFLYLHNHKGDSCTIVDQTVIGEEIVKDLVSKFI
jgi:hypothetical protein